VRDVGCGGIIGSIIISFVGIVIIVRGCWFGVGGFELLRFALSFLLLQFGLSLQTVLPSRGCVVLHWAGYLLFHHRTGCWAG
jgi:hypothetical protein